MSRFRVTCAAVLAVSTMMTSPAGADVVLDWNVIALKTSAAAAFNPPLESRNLAIVHAAIFDAVNAINRQYRSYAVTLRAPDWASAEAAAAAAAHAALVLLYPEQQPALDAAYAASIGAMSNGPAKTRGVAIGESVALRIVKLRASDGAAAAIAAAYAPGDRPGAWAPTPPAFLPALDPGWGRVRPFVLRHGGQFNPGPPPALTSGPYARDFDEIKAIGSSTSTTRTQDQTDLARFWVATAPQNWNPVARQLSIAHALTLSQNARAFALLNLAGADAFIAAWHAKFTHHQWRPVTAIRGADTDRNPRTEADPAWTPLLVTPPFPDYIAGHTSYAGAAQKVLESIFGTEPGVRMILTSPTAPGIVEEYETFKAIADGVVEARVWGGIHWRTSSVRGRTVGEQIGSFVVRHAARARDSDDDREDRR